MISRRPPVERKARKASRAETKVTEYLQKSGDVLQPLREASVALVAGKAGLVTGAGPTSARHIGKVRPWIQGRRHRSPQRFRLAR
jgi:hypothetical protein